MKDKPAKWTDPAAVTQDDLARIKEMTKRYRETFRQLGQPGNSPESLVEVILICHRLMSKAWLPDEQMAQAAAKLNNVTSMTNISAVSLATNFIAEYCAMRQKDIWKDKEFPKAFETTSKN